MKIIFWISALVLFRSLPALGNRQKRFLIVPPTAPTRHQWIAGIGIPLDLENIAVTTGYVLKAQYFLPTQVDHLFPLDTWEDIERPKQKRDLRNQTDNQVQVLRDNATGTEYSQYNVPAVVIAEGPNSSGGSDKSSGRGFAYAEDEFDDWNEDSEVEQDSKAAEKYWSGLREQSPGTGLETSRWDAYKLLEGVTNSHGAGGKDCVLRTICESAASPISHKSGILGELLHILLTPSTSGDKVSTEEHQQYLIAEKLGQGTESDSGVCEERYPDCQRSLMDVFTSFDNPFENLFNSYL